ncbi:MAG: stalk domain-containing protein [Clostridia bacterium]|nr:stalk domain-containing protein [Clostridia bacterium]
MRLRTKIMLSIVSFILLFSVQYSFAAEARKDTTITLNLNQTSMKVVKDGVTSTFTMDVPAKAPRGTTLVPVRAVLEPFNAVLNYDAARRQVHITKDGTTIVLTIDSKVAVVNGKQTTLLEPATLENNRTLVPLRFISESLGYAVGWEAETKTITISNNGVVGGSNTASNEPAEKKTELYYAIKKGMEEYRSEIDVSAYVQKTTSTDDVFKVYLDVLNENPEIFYCIGKFKYGSGGKVYPEYAVSKEQIPGMKSAFNTRVDNIMKEVIKPGMSDFQKEAAIHDYIIHNVRYDYENLSKGNEIWYNYSAYGAIVNRSGVCESYAKAMKLLAGKAGLYCKVITGKAENSGGWGPHAWNIIRINGKYYHVDVTFDDPISGEGDTLSYSYLNLTDAQISIDHSWESKDKYPKCESTEFNYYVVNNLYANNYDEFYSKLSSAIKEGKKEVSIKVSNYDSRQYDIASAFKKIGESNSYRSYKYYYSVDDKHGIISITGIEFRK